MTNGDSSACVSPPFTDYMALKTAVNACLALDATGVACCAAGTAGGSQANCANNDTLACGVARCNEMAHWNTALVTRMPNLFEKFGSFNADISAWDVSATTTFYRMFMQAKVFNQDISGWNVSSWNVSSITDMEHMFFMAEAFNQPLGDWDVSALINARWVFERANSFNQPLNNWDVSKVTDMHHMFSNALAFNQTLSLWDVSAVTNMFGMFLNAKAFNSPLNWGNRLSGGPSMSSMFQGALLFNQDLRSSWNISAITTNQNMRLDASVMSDSNKPCTTPATNAHPLFWPAC